jgi:hypothetical protein
MLTGGTIQLATYCPSYLRIPNLLIYLKFILKMAVAVFVETLGDIEHSPRLTPESLSQTTNSGPGKLGKYMRVVCSSRRVLL